MLKRKLIGLLAVCLVMIFMAEAANAAVRRIRRTVENHHECTDSEDSCYDAESVTDKAFGAVRVGDVGSCSEDQFEITTIPGADPITNVPFNGCYVPTCQMTGTLICATDRDCGVVEETDVGISQDSFESTGFFGTDGKAIGISVLDTDTGNFECISRNEGRYYDYKPNAIMVLSNYSFASGSGSDYAIIEVCPTFAEDVPPHGADEFVCEEVWNSDSGVEQPHLPCCGMTKSLDVDIVGQGTVTSDPAGIDCTSNTGECSVVYDGFNAPIDACPVSTFTLAASSPTADWEFIEWLGDCTGGSCTVTPETSASNGYGSVTAVFWPVVTVDVDGNGTVTSTPGDIACASIGGLCSMSFDPVPNPTVTLTADPGVGLAVVWEGCDSETEEGECIVTPPADVTASFREKGIITVVVVGGGEVWIKSPHKAYYTDPEPLSKYCDSVCTIDTKEKPFLGVNPIVLKRVGDFDKWQGPVECEGDNNSNRTCLVYVDPTGAPIEVIANFNP